MTHHKLFSLLAVTFVVIALFGCNSGGSSPTEPPPPGPPPPPPPTQNSIQYLSHSPMPNGDTMRAGGGDWVTVDFKAQCLPEVGDMCDFDVKLLGENGKPISTKTQGCCGAVPEGTYYPSIQISASMAADLPAHTTGFKLLVTDPGNTDDVWAKQKETGPDFSYDWVE